MDREIQGDWSDLKGSVYHLWYAVWLLIAGEATEVAFFEGNDLRTTPIQPPIGPEFEDAPPTVACVSQIATDDEWVQLKSTEEQWSTSDLLDEDLFANFVCNALHSERHGRSWRVRLVSQGAVTRLEVLRYVEDPTGRPRLNTKLGASLDRVRRRYQDEGLKEDLSDDRLHPIAFAILRQLAACHPVQLATLVAEIRERIAYQLPDREAALRTANALVGTMHLQAGKGPDAAIVYDRRWIRDASGGVVGVRTLFTEDPATACNEAVRAALPRDWEDAQCAPRPRLEHALDRFLESSAPVFVLVAPSGSGKTWGLAGWLTRVLTGRIRILIHGRDVLSTPNLAPLIAGAMRPFAPAGLAEGAYLERLRAAATVAGQGPLVVAVDDLFVPRGGSDRLRHDLARLVDQIRANGAKLVLTCQAAVWDLHRLGRELNLLDVFHLDREAPQVKETEDIDAEGRSEPRSLLLGVLADQELEQIVARRLPAGRADAVTPILLSPTFQPLRNPYLLDLYLTQHHEALVAPSSQPTPVAIDNLLDQRIETAMVRCAAALNSSAEEVGVAFAALSEEMWGHRPSGVLRRAAAQVLDSQLLPGQGGVALEALQDAGLLSDGPSVAHVEPAIAERVYARRILGHLDKGPEALANLRPEDDSGIAAAVLRAAIEPIPLAENLLARDSRWKQSVCAGLAQGDGNDARVLALLTLLARPDANGSIGGEACEALGALATRTRRAWKWAAHLYLSDVHLDRILGRRALAAAINATPHPVTAAVRFRFARADRLDTFHSAERRKQERLLNGAVEPFLSVQDRRAAHYGRRLLHRYERLLRGRPSEIEKEAVWGFDEARGVIALALGGDDLERLIAELGAPEPESRFQGARALRPVAIDAPKLVVDALCEAIRTEGESGVAMHLLWAASTLVKEAPTRLLDALATGPSVQWDTPSATAGQALCLLSELVDLDPARVVGLLPHRLDKYDPELRALHSEALAFAWWRAAEAIREDREHLDALTEPDLLNVPKEFRVFALRGAAIARLGAMSLDAVLSAELVDRHFLYNVLRPQFLFVWTDEFVTRHVETLAAHPQIEVFQSLLFEAVRAEDEADNNPLNRHLLNSALVCATRCLEILVSLAAASPNPMDTLQALPRGRPVLYAALRMLERGIRSNEVVNYVKEICEDDGTNTVTEGSREREQCLAILAGLADNPDRALTTARERRRRMLDIDDAPALTLAELGERTPLRFLALLNEIIDGPEDLQTLHRLDQTSRRWEQLLIARVYRRMFLPAPILGREARDLCEQMLTAVRSLPDSPERREYETVYGAISARLSHRPVPVPKLPPGDHALQQTHRWALMILGADFRAIGEDGLRLTLDQVVCDSRGWWENPMIGLRGDGIDLFRGTVYVPPAVRLSQIAVGKEFRIIDPSGGWMLERIETEEFIRKWNYTFEGGWGEVRERERALQSFRDKVTDETRDDRLWWSYGHLALLTGNYLEAEEALQRCLALPWNDQESRRPALLDLACVYSRVGAEHQAHIALDQAHLLRPLDSNWLATDPDLAPLRNRGWFQELIAGH